MRINLVLGHQLAFPPSEGGGANRLVWVLANEFVRLGNEVVCYSPLRDGRAPEELDVGGVRHRRVTGARFRPNQALNNLLALPYAMNLAGALREADVTCFHTPFSFLLGQIPRLGVCTHTIHRTPKWFSAMYGSLDRVYVGSSRVAAEAARIAPNLEEKLLAIPNCVEIAEKPERFPRADDEVRLIYVGRFTRDKGLDVLIHAFLDAASRDGRLRLSVVGPQESSEGGDSHFFHRMREVVSKHPTKNAVQFERPIYEVELLRMRMLQADLFCLPSLDGETLNMSALEAAACGLPLLVSSVGGNPELVPPTRRASVLPPGNLIAWRLMIEDAARCGRDVLAEMGEEFREHVVASFTPREIACRYLADFAELMARHR